MTDPVVIAAFRFDLEADAARRAILAGGIIADAVPRTDAYPRLCDDLFDGGFDVVVSRADAPAALDLVHQLWPDPPRTEPVAQCPACGSTSIARIPRLRIFVFAAILLVALGELAHQRELFLLVLGIVAVLLLVAKPMRCRTCGERWRGEPSAPDDPVEGPPVLCPRCGSEETEPISRRRERAWTLLVNYVLPPLILVWPLRPRRRCGACGWEWR